MQYFWDENWMMVLSFIMSAFVALALVYFWFTENAKAEESLRVYLILISLITTVVFGYFALSSYQKAKKFDFIAAKLEPYVQNIKMPSLSASSSGIIDTVLPEKTKQMFASGETRNVVIVDATGRLQREHWDLPERLRAVSPENIELIIQIQTGIGIGGRGGINHYVNKKSSGTEYEEFDDEINASFLARVSDLRRNVILAEKAFEKRESAGRIARELGNPIDTALFEHQINDMQDKLRWDFYEWLGINR